MIIISKNNTYVTMDPQKIHYTIEPTKEGPPTLAVEVEGKKIHLHSRMFPARESQECAAGADPDKFDMLIVLGTGLGYHLAGLKDSLHTFTSVILIDILQGIKKEISKIEQTSFLAESGNVVFIDGLGVDEIEDKLRDHIRLDDIRGVIVIEHPQSMRVFGEYYRNVKKIIQKLIDKNAANLATRKTFGRLYLRNIVKNLSCIDLLKPVKGLFGGFAGYPAVVVTSGPSLDAHLPLLREMQERFFIIAVDSALSVLTLNSIIPDFTVSIDPQPYINEHFQGILLTHTIPIFSISVHSALLKKYRGFLSLNSHPAAQVIEQEFPGIVGSIDSGTGTVAGDAVAAGIRFGFKSIALMGFDFSFPDYSIYARGSAYQRRYGEFFQSRIRTIESSNMHYIMKSSRGFAHAGKYTRKSFLQYKSALEDLIKTNQDSSVINIKGKGLRISGADEMEFREFIASNTSSTLDKKNIISGVLEDMRPFSDLDMKRKIISLISGGGMWEEIACASLGEDNNTRKTVLYRSLLNHI